MKHVRFCLECRRRYVRPTSKPFLKPFLWPCEPDVTDAHSFSSACYLHPVSDGWKPLHSVDLQLGLDFGEVSS